MLQAKDPLVLTISKIPKKILYIKCQRILILYHIQDIHKV